jgi:DNA invertase Pin-like site-specific DNA recombinase
MQRLKMAGGSMKVAIYGRVSTSEQNAAMQVDELRSYCERRQRDIAEEFIDSGVSGAKERRPPLDRLLAEAKRRKFDAVLVYRYDRFARSLRQLVNAFVRVRRAWDPFRQPARRCGYVHSQWSTGVWHLR